MTSFPVASAVSELSPGTSTSSGSGPSPLKAQKKRILAAETVKQNRIPKVVQSKIKFRPAEHMGVMGPPINPVSPLQRKFQKRTSSWVSSGSDSSSTKRVKKWLRQEHSYAYVEVCIFLHFSNISFGILVGLEVQTL